MYLNKKVFLLFKIGSMDIEINESVKHPKAPNTDLRKFRQMPLTLPFNDIRSINKYIS